MYSSPKLVTARAPVYGLQETAATCRQRRRHLQTLAQDSCNRLGSLLHACGDDARATGLREVPFRWCQNWPLMKARNDQHSVRGGSAFILCRQFLEYGWSVSGRC